MIIIPKVIKDKLDRDNAKFNVRISFPNGERTDICNNMIVNGTTKFTESLCSQDELKFGLCESPQFECETVGVGNIKGCLIDVAYEVICTPDVLGSEWKTDIQEHVFSIPVGRFVVTSCDRQADMQHRKVVAYGGGAATRWEMPEHELFKIKYGLTSGTYTSNLVSVISTLFSLEDLGGDGFLFNQDPIAAYESLPFPSGINKRLMFTIKTMYYPMLNIDTRPYAAIYEHQTSVADALDYVLREALRGSGDEELYDYFKQSRGYGFVLKNTEKAFAFDTYSITNSNGNEYSMSVNKGTLINGYMPILQSEKYTVCYAVECFVEQGLGTIARAEKMIVDPEEARFHLYNIPSEIYYLNYDVNSTNIDKYIDLDLQSVFSNAVELTGQFARITRENKIEFASLHKHFYLLPEDYLRPRESLKPLGLEGGSVGKHMYSSLWYEEAYTKPYGAIHCFYKNSNGVEVDKYEYLEGYDENTDVSTYLIYDISENENIKNGFYTDYQLEIMMYNMRFYLDKISYVPVKLQTVALPYVESGDTLEVLTQNNDSITTIVLNRTMTGESYITDEFTSI